MEFQKHLFSAEKADGLLPLNGTYLQHVDALTWNFKNASHMLERKIAQHNEAQAGKGLVYLRSFLSNVVRYSGWEAAKPLLDAVNGPRPQTAVPLAKALLSQTYEDADSQFIASQIALSVSKYPFVGSSDIARINGLTVFTDGERRNRHCNALFKARRRSGAFTNDPFWMHVKHYIREVLGEAPLFYKWVDGAGWGPGASVGVTGQFTNFARKLLSDKWTVTPTALPYALTIAKRLPVFWEALGLTHAVAMDDGTYLSPRMNIDLVEFETRFMARVEVICYNKLALVPKEADKDRVIASEPLLNQLCQMAADHEMRLKLRRVGIDLRDQNLNQQWAREGSLGGSNARCTIDLTNASGSIFVELVRECLGFCPDWFIAMNAIRSPSYRNPFGTTPEATERYHMFSSMGNCVTFPLETLIFASICFAAHKYCGTTPDFRCYGDDIIVKQNEALYVLEKLRHMGLKANTAKTFVFGPFRESCGSDWYCGESVRPIVFDTTLSRVEERVRIHNALVRLPRTTDAQLLSACCVNWFPPFMSDFVRPFADHTDEAIDGRFLSGPPKPSAKRCLNFDSPAWYGLTFSSLADNEVVENPRYPVALHYAGLLGASSSRPFTMRRETRMRVARFSHSGNTSSWVPQRQPGIYLAEWKSMTFVGPRRPVRTSDPSSMIPRS